MRRSQFFWGIVLLVLGVLLLLENLGILKVSVWGVFWPLVMIFGGGWLLLGMFWRPAIKTENAAAALEGASRLRVKLRHGAGRLSLAAGDDSTQAVTGSFEGGVDLKTTREGDELLVRLRVPEEMSFWGRRHGFNWNVGLNRSVPLALDMKCGASENRLDLTGLRLADLNLDTGASDTELILPSGAGAMTAAVSMGAAALKVRVPAGVAGRFRIRGGVSSADVDQARFPRSGDYYQSTDFETAADRIDLTANVGAGSIEIR